MPTWNSRGLRGSTLEDLINRTNEKYSQNNLALIQKIPTPITPINIDKDTRHITLAYFDQRSTVDYIGAVQGIPVCFDAKECKFTPYYTGNSGGMCDNDRIRISSYEKKDTFVLVMTNPTSEDLTGVKVTSKYPAECELLSKKEVSGTAFEVDMPAYETLFVKCKK